MKKKEKRPIKIAEIRKLKKLYRSVKDDISSRISQFRLLGSSGKEEDIFQELIFCILTPQSRAKSCWKAAMNLSAKGLLEGKEETIVKELNQVRFKYKKAGFILGARKLFKNDGKIMVKKRIAEFESVSALRKWLVTNVRGLGYKEASHFLRNIGLGRELAILDRHVLRSLKSFGVIDGIPDSLSEKKYLSIEKKLIGFAKEVKIPVEEVDLLLWYKQTGEIFK